MHFMYGLAGGSKSEHMIFIASGSLATGSREEHVEQDSSAI
jgi:hypothetical protein